MEKGKAPAFGAGGGWLPPSARFSGLPPVGSSFGFSSGVLVKGETTSHSAGLSPMPALGQFVQQFPLGSEQFSNGINGLPDLPLKFSGHRRAQSEIIGLPTGMDTGVSSGSSGHGVVGAADGPNKNENEDDDDLFSLYMNLEKLNAECGSPSAQEGEPSAEVALVLQTPQSPAESLCDGASEKHKVRHQHSLSMDDCISVKSETLESSTEGTLAPRSRKAMSAARLAELARVDPKRAKRIWANRQSAARSKERKMRYIAELEQRVQSLRVEATTMSAHLNILKRDTDGLTAENNELKLRLQSMEQEVHMQDALNDAMRDEVQRLREIAGVIPAGGQMMNYAAGYDGIQQFNPYALMSAQQLRQFEIHPSQSQPAYQPSGEMRNRGTTALYHRESDASDWVKNERF